MPFEMLWSSMPAGATLPGCADVLDFTAADFIDRVVVSLVETCC